ncbi:MAG: sugar isomerase [Planctomycetes bacterium RBG_13_63_9]|nr:MAG: sugar isomerase [Planctomycetes bacterium RBG_13_63_9]
MVVKPIFAYSTYAPRPQTSWRAWGGIQTQKDAEEEIPRIKAELDKLQTAADFPVQFLPIAPVRNAAEVSALKDVASADVLLVYAADGGDAIDAVGKSGKDVIFFLRHKSGPVYLWYEIISPRYLRQHTDELKVQGIDFQDVVVDSQDEVLWRLRSLCGLRNTVGSRILAVGGPGGWAQPTDTIVKLVKDRWKLDIRTVPYDELGKLIQAAREDQAAVNLARRRADEYLKLPGTTLETKREFVDNAFLLDQVFRMLMAKAECRAMTINSCMGTIMPLARTSACLALSTLNDDAYQAYCESDFVVIPAGMLLVNISGHPNFLNDPTYPHDGIITLAHCTGPRKMDGKTIEPARILTHFESDYGAAPTVEMRKGQKVTNIVPDFKAERWLGFLGEIVEAPFLPTICRDQIDISFECDTSAVAERMPGFHWMTIYGDYLREAGYALKKIPIKWECLG